jgi:uncharacterized membrane protein
MKVAGLVIGILGMILAFIVLIICLMLPSMTNNRVNFEESLVGVIPAVLVGFISFIVTVISLLTILKNKQKS